MTAFLDTTGRPTYGIGLCARCARKFPLDELAEDPNFPALMVCRDDIDQYDPYRLAPRPEDHIVLPFIRPDISVSTAPSGIISESETQFLVAEDNESYLEL